MNLDRFLPLAQSQNSAAKEIKLKRSVILLSLLLAFSFYHYFISTFLSFPISGGESGHNRGY